MSKPQHVVIIGSGVIGLTVAYVLSQKHPSSDVSITIIARDMPDNGMNSTGWSSPWAGANWFPFVNRDPENRWETVALKRFTSGEVPQHLVMDLPIKYFAPDANRLDMLWYRDIIKSFQILPQPFPESIEGTPPAPSAFEFTTISVNAPAYLLWLQEELKKRGVKFITGWVSSIEDVEYVPGLEERIKTDVVINASGLGAKSIVGIADPLVYPIRGQTVLVRAPEVKWSLMGMGLHINNETGEVIYTIPRSNGDVIVGGTFQEHNWDVSPDPKTATLMLERALIYCPELSQATPPSLEGIQVLRHNVGLRPSRKGGARLEKEVVSLPLSRSDNSKNSWEPVKPIPSAMNGPESVEALGGQFNWDNKTARTINVVHAYGIGTSGYQASWGIAEDVANIVEGILAGTN